MTSCPHQIKLIFSAAVGCSHENTKTVVCVSLQVLLINSHSQPNLCPLHLLLAPTLPQTLANLTDRPDPRGCPPETDPRIPTPNHISVKAASTRSPSWGGRCLSSRWACGNTHLRGGWEESVWTWICGSYGFGWTNKVRLLNKYFQWKLWCVCWCHCPLKELLCLKAALSGHCEVGVWTVKIFTQMFCLLQHSLTSVCECTDPPPPCLPLSLSPSHRSLLRAAERECVGQCQSCSVSQSCITDCFCVRL